MTPQETFITRLRRHRERNRISLDEIASETRIRREQLEALESGDLDGWPRGLYARAWVRAYANVIGLDPTDTVDEFCRLFPHGDRRAGATFRDVSDIISHASDYRDELVPEHDRRRRDPDVKQITPPPTWRDQMLRMVQRLRGLKSARTARASRAVRTIHMN